MRRSDHKPPQMTAAQFRRALAATGWTLERFCLETGIRPDRCLAYERDRERIPPQTRALVIALRSPEARDALVAANRAAKIEEDAIVQAAHS